MVAEAVVPISAEVAPSSAETMPSSTEQAGKKTSHTHTIVSMNEHSDTVVILFGWAGCRDRYLVKYAQYYEEAGFSTIRFTVPIAKVRSFAAYHHYAKVFYKETLESGVKFPEKVYFHTFSMNGCSVFTTFWDLLSTKEEGEKLKSRVRGVLYDSSPAHTSPSQSANAISYATLPPSHYHCALRESYRVLLFTFFSMHRGFMWMQSLIDSDIYEKNFAYFRLLAMNDLPKRQLFLYGPGDDVCSEESIEMFASEMEQRGVSVVRKNMKDSLHCQHYRTYPEEYKEACISFIEHSNKDA